MERAKLIQEVTSWFENELMMNSQPAIMQIEDEDERVGKDFERRAAIINFSAFLEKALRDELNNGQLVSLKYKEEEGNLLNEIAEKSLVEKEWLPECYVVVGEGSGMSVYR